MKITNIYAREILNCQGEFTVECSIELDNDSIVTASSASGISTSRHEAKQFFNPKSKILSNNISRPVDIINNILAPMFISKEPNAIEADIQILQLDGTSDKSNLGINAILPFSMAMYRAHALESQMELFDFIAYVSGLDTITLPVPMINFVSGGVHADNNLSIQEFLVVPYGCNNIRYALENSISLLEKFKQTLTNNQKAFGVGIEGALVSNFKNSLEVLDLLKATIDNNNLSDFFSMGLDVAASTFYNPQDNIYSFEGTNKNAEQMIRLYEDLNNKYNLFSIEDGLDQDDLSGWIKLNEQLGKKLHVVGDDVFATNPDILAKGIELLSANAIIIKPNQIGTVTEALQTIKLAQENDFSVIVSHRSRETNDDFIVDLAVGSNANYIKCGGLNRGERIAKYNRLLEIESQLQNL